MTKTIKVAKLSEDTLNLLVGNGLTKEQVALINSPTPEQWIKKRKGRGGKEFDYIPVGITIKVLNSVFGFNWSFDILKEEIIQGADQVLVKGRLTVKTESGEIHKENFASKEIARYGEKTTGYENGKKVEIPNPRAGQIISIGDEMKGATSLCLTKCASMFGLFSDIYSSEFYSKWEMPDGEEVAEDNTALDEGKINNYKFLLNAAKTQKEFESIWSEIPPVYKKELNTLKNELKTKYEHPQV